MDGFRYRAFISYSHADEKWAAWLHKALESYTVPSRLVGRPSPLGPIPAKLAPVFRDREELPSANDLGQKLQSALEASATLILICSPASAKSRWVNEEVLSFKRLGRAHRIFCIIVNGEPNHPEDECFPPAAKFQLDAFGQLSQTPAEPIAADARTGKDGRNMAKTKLIAGMLDVGFDDLRQRELHRRHRRLAFITTVSVVGMVIAVGLMFAAMMARTEAEKQRELARIQAEKAKQTAAFMVDLFSVSDPSEARGRSITAREILMRGADTIDTQLSDQPQVQAGLMETIGKVYVSLGLFEDAEPLLRKATEKRAARPTEQLTEIMEKANGHLLLANVLTEKANYLEAEKLYQLALAELNIAAPKTPLLTDTLAALAELYFRTGRFKDARPLLEQVLAQRKSRLGENHPKVADAMAELGLNYFDQGDYEQAEQRLKSALVIQRRIYQGKPHPDIGETLNNLGLILSESQRLADAEPLYAEAIEINRALFGEFHPSVAIGLNNLGLLARRMGELNKADELFNQALKIHRHIHGENHPQIALVLTNLALTYYENDAPEEARKTLNHAITMQQTQLSLDDPQIARSQAILGRWIFESGDYQKAKALQLEAITNMSKVLDAKHPQLISSQIHYAETLIALTEYSAAESMLNKANAAMASDIAINHWMRAWHKSVSGLLNSKVGNVNIAQQQLTESANQLNADQFANAAQVAAAKKRLENFQTELYDLTNTSTVATP